MSKRKHHRKELRTEKAFIKNVLFSLLVILIILSLHLFLSEFVFKDIDTNAKKGTSATALSILDVDVKSDIISINNQKSPNINVDVRTNYPANLIIKMESVDFSQTININEFRDEHNINLLLPENLFGKEILLDMLLYDQYSRKALYEEIYTIPAITKPKVSIN